MKVDINDVAAALNAASSIPAAIKRQIIEDLNRKIAQAEEEKGEREPKQKQRHVILLSDPEGKLGKDPLTGWVVTIPESESDATALDRIVRAGHDFNTTKRGRLYPAKTVGEVCENVPRRFFKEYDVTVRTKAPAYAFPVPNALPEAPSV